MESNRQKKRKESNFVVQGSILAVASIVVRIIGIAYRIPMINIIGDEGMGYYGTAFNVYNIALLLSSYSLPLAVSKMVSARLAGKQYRNAARILRAALCYATIVGAFAAAVIWFGADFFAKDVFFMPYAAFALRTLAPTVWIMAYLGVFRGYFQGQGTMVPTAFSQVFEQIVNAIVSVAAGSFLFNEALKTEVLKNQTGDGYSNAWGAAGGTIGTGAGAFTALIFLLFLFAALRPGAERVGAGAELEDLAFEQLCALAAGREGLVGAAHAAAAGGGEGDDGLAGQVAALEEGIDDRRRDIPPDGEADEDRVVAGKVRAALGDLRPGGRILHLDGAAGLLVHPVEVGFGIGDLRPDLKQVRIHGSSQLFGKLLRHAGSGKIGDKFFAHKTYLLWLVPDFSIARLSSTPKGSPFRGAVSRRLTERLSQICIEKPKPQVSLAVWKGRNEHRG